MVPPSDAADDLGPREAERVRRRDRDATAEERALLRPGMGKVFKQILDSQRDAASQVPPAGKRKAKRAPGS
jgi:hypothetical protein